MLSIFIAKINLRKIKKIKKVLSIFLILVKKNRYIIFFKITIANMKMANRIIKKNLVFD